MGDRLGTPSAVVIFVSLQLTSVIEKTYVKCWIFDTTSRQRPYHVENTSSRPITEVKQRWAWLVLGWETAWEHQVLLSFCCFLSALCIIKTYVITWIFDPTSWQRPYHVENTSSRPITEVKQRWAWLVLGWETAWEHQVLLSFWFCYVGAEHEELNLMCHSNPISFKKDLCIVRESNPGRPRGRRAFYHWTNDAK